MQIDVSGHNLEVTPALRNSVTTKLQKLEHRFNNITHVNVILKVESKNQQQAEATVNMSHGQIFASASSNDMYHSIDDLYDKLSRQVTKHKEKMKDHDQDLDHHKEV